MNVMVRQPREPDHPDQTTSRNRRATGPTLALVSVFALVAGTGTAQPQTVAEVQDLATSAETLRAALHDLIDDHLRLPYTANARDTWDMLEVTDKKTTDATRIVDVYKNALFPKAGGGNTNYNREHTWPKSYGFKREGAGNCPYTDGHYLFLSDSRYSSSRSYKPYRSCGASCTERPMELTNGRGGRGPGTHPAVPVLMLVDTRERADAARTSAPARPGD
jgi:hypothetical protein